jgi:hypothetical protein
VILLISASWVTRITGVSYRCPAQVHYAEEKYQKVTCCMIPLLYSILRECINDFQRWEMVVREVREDCGCGYRRASERDLCGEGTDQWFDVVVAWIYTWDKMTELYT